MKISFDRSSMLSAFSVAASVAPTRSPSPILQNILLKADGATNTISVVATDTENTITINVDGATIEQPGECLLSASRFLNILRESSDKQLKITASADGNTHKIRLKGDGANYTMQAIPASDYPRAPESKHDAYHVVSAGRLRDAILRVIYASDTESNRYALTSVLAEFGEDSLTLACSDGRRLAVCAIGSKCVNGHDPATINGGQSILIPHKAATLISRAFPDAEGEVRVFAGVNQVVAFDDRVRVTVRLTEGRFPRWRDVIPSASGTDDITLSPQAMLSVIRQAAVVTNDESKSISVSFKEGRLFITASTAEVGKCEASIPVEFSGDLPGQRLDWKYLADFFKGVPAESKVTWHRGDVTAAAHFLSGTRVGDVKSEESQGGLMAIGSEYVLMPLESDK